MMETLFRKTLRRLFKSYDDELKSTEETLDIALSRTQDVRTETAAFKEKAENAIFKSRLLFGPTDETPKDPRP